LGLYVRTFHPYLMTTVNGILAEQDAELRAYFWHGAGRALYFRPLNWGIWSIGQALCMAKREAADEVAHCNLSAGLGWALTMVNLRHPALLADLVVSGHGRELDRNEAFADGVAAGMVMRADTTPGFSSIEELRHFRAPARHSGAWQRLFDVPIERGLSVCLPRAQRECRLGEVFRYGGSQ
jgi:hypothetical protein